MGRVTVDRAAAEPRTSRPEGSLREQLIDAAEAEISQNGLSKASLRAIARRCGVSHQASAHHFADRAGLLTALATRGFALLGRELEEAIAAAPPERGAPVAAVGVAYVRFAEEHATTFDVMYQSDLIHPDDPDYVQAKWHVWQQLMGEVTAAQSRGWATHVPVDTLALTCWSYTHGLAAIRRDAAQTVSAISADLDYAQVITVMTDALDVQGQP